MYTARALSRARLAIATIRATASSGTAALSSISAATRSDTMSSQSALGRAMAVAVLGVRSPASGVT